MLLEKGKTVSELLYLADSYVREFDAAVVAVDAETNSVALDRTALFATGGGQPHDTGRLTFRSARTEPSSCSPNASG
jgi:misacylated tRNA(Ala) deacylase